MKVYIILILAFLSFNISTSAQDCTDYHQYHCVFSDYTYFYSRQSKSLLMKPGESASINMVAYAGEDYYLSVCAHRKFGNVQYKILADDKAKTVIYDNAFEDYPSSVVFSNEVTRNLIIELIVPGNIGSEKDRKCVGLLIQFKKINK